MAWNFKKSKSFGKFARLNISKRGVGFSLGAKGFRVGVNSKGVYRTFSIPRTGLSNTKYISTSKKTPSNNLEEKSYDPFEIKNYWFGFTSICLIISAIILMLTPAVGVFLLIISVVVSYFWAKSPEQQSIFKYKKARSLLKDNNFDDAYNLLKEAVNLAPENYIMNLFLGSVLHDSGNYDESIVYLKKCMEMSPNTHDLKLAIGSCLYNSGKYDDGIEILQTMPVDALFFIRSLSLLAACFDKKDQYDLAIEVLKRAPLQKRKLDEDLKEVHYNLAIIYAHAGDSKKALKHAQKIYSQDVNYRNIADMIKELELGSDLK